MCNAHVFLHCCTNYLSSNHFACYVDDVSVCFQSLYCSYYHPIVFGILYGNVKRVPGVSILSNQVAILMHFRYCLGPLLILAHSKDFI